MEVLEPYGNFSLNYKSAVLSDLVFVGAGSGITPLISMMKSALSQAQNRICLIYGSRSEADILFDKEIKRLQTQYPTRLRVAHYLSREVGEGYKTGRISTEGVMQTVKAWAEFKVEEANYYLCGPKPMMDEVESGLKSHRIDSSQIHRESFVLTVSDQYSEAVAGSKPGPAEASPQSGHTVRIMLEGRTHTLEVAAGRHILETALDAGLDLPYACTMGVCGMCRAFKVEGEMQIGEQEALSRSEIEQGYCLTCVGKPLSSQLLIDYDRR